MKLVSSNHDNLDESSVVCNCCGIVLAKFENDKMIPSPEKLLKNGAIPIPNFGWFCSQDCGNKYEEKYEIHFQRNQSGEIEYY